MIAMLSINRSGARAERRWARLRHRHVDCGMFMGPGFRRDDW